jgi:serine O-acetyltransferase
MSTFIPDACLQSAQKLTFYIRHINTELQMNSWDAMKADTYRQFGQFSWGCLIKGIIMNKTFRVVVTMRLCQFVRNSINVVPLSLSFFKALHHIAAHCASVDLPWQTKIGGGLCLTHGWGLVISPGAQIGNNVTLFHGVTLGRRDRISPEGERLTEYPVLEDEVWVGPHAIIIGGVTIGRGSRIAGGTFVTVSIPPYSVVSGNPAAIVKSNCVPDVLNQAPI